MTPTKSLLLDSAATLVVVAGAQAADLPTKKGVPAAEYVKVCQVGSIAGFIIPGSDTCLKAERWKIARPSADARPGTGLFSPPCGPAMLPFCNTPLRKGDSWPKLGFFQFELCVGAAIVAEARGGIPGRGTWAEWRVRLGQPNTSKATKMEDVALEA
jgi:hypothetical protein